MKKEVIAHILIFSLITVMLLPLNVFASANIEYKISPTTTTPKVGSEVEVIISLTNYSEIPENIRALQIDVTNIDPSIVEVISHSSLINANEAMSNKTSYQSKKNLVRLVYIYSTEMLDKNVTDVMKFKLKIKDSLDKNGSIIFPITFYIGTEDENITIKDSLKLDYNTTNEDNISIDVSWGKMEFVYDDGIWNSDRHQWEKNGWKPLTPKDNLISIKNSGNKDVYAELNYNSLNGYADLKGKFIDEKSNDIVDPIFIKTNENKEILFNLTGLTTSRWVDNMVNIGNITLTISD